MMRPETIARTLTFALLVAGTSILAAPEQTATPGQMTQAHVWVENRGRAEALPVELSRVNLETPLKVQVIMGDAGLTRFGAVPVQVDVIAKRWEYETVIIAPTEDMATRLNTRGASGWETTGIWSVDGGGVTKVLLKRPRLP
jgi:hypothetical protein